MNTKKLGRVVFCAKILLMQRYLFGIGLFCLGLLSSVAEPPASRQIARRVADRVMLHNAVWGSYTFDLALEAMLEFDSVAGCSKLRDYALGIVEQRGWEANQPAYTAQPFCHLNWKVYETTGNEAFVKPFVMESERYRNEVTRSPEGAITHKPDEPGRYLLIDQLQDYAARMARTGKLTGDETYYAECAEQFRIYRELVRDPQTGLWCQGRGWLDDPMELSPGAWSRGQGWVIRGMVDSLCALPRDSKEFAAVQGYLQELANALVAAQGPDGMWYQLLHLSPERSAPDTTGTGMIIYYFSRALEEGFLVDPKFRRSAEQAFNTLTQYVTPEGLVLQACPGPGPLNSVEPYLGNAGRTEDGESHGPFCVIYACAGKVLLDQSAD
jgi:rhamnogalacturonyl hydrolase YesR